MTYWDCRALSYQRYIFRYSKRLSNLMNQLSFDLNRYFFLCRSYQIVLKDPYDEADKLNSCDLKYKDQQLEKIADEFFVFFGLLKLSP